ncbi:hypothetical protein SH2C18_45020 [Clostridium sediminicola]|uniref:hypothetical protein n=1 Tax=Clostridium sediminicola TaxID=3114879 RepID=UPI0031F24CCB
MFDKRSKVVFVSMVLGGLYLIYILTHFLGASSSSQGTEQAGAIIATALVAPHMFLVLLAVIFNIISFLSTKVWACITGLVLYCVAGLVFLLYAPFIAPMIILMAVGIGKTKKINSLKTQPIAQ